MFLNSVINLTAGFRCRRVMGGFTRVLIEKLIIPNRDAMAINSYREYKRREFCKDVKCPIQVELDAQKEGAEQHEAIRHICATDCRYTTYQFHHWLINKGYMIIRPEE
ncbi:MAG: hypothetical protein A2176_12760 [Spirochaetes bacterium RBG_13_51_14]|nr:MAG: hypothetical protein A2176_12760 [Spirochaetes bacterium RBG_13_51_14]